MILKNLSTYRKLCDCTYLSINTDIHTYGDSDVSENQAVFKECIRLHGRSADGPRKRSYEKQSLEQNRMKNFWNTILEFLESVGRARAANELVRAGRYEEARRLFEKDTEVHP